MADQSTFARCGVVHGALDNGVDHPRHACRERNSRWTPWSVLLWRVLGVVGMACSTCGKGMVLRAEVRPPATLTVLASRERSVSSKFRVDA